MSIIPGTLDQPARFVLAQGSDRTLEASIAAFVPTDFLACFPQGAGRRSLGEKSLNFKASPLFVSPAPDLGSRGKLFPDKHYLCIARIRGNRET
jgi:hypothetical protein